MTATAYICYNDGTPSEAQTFTSKEELVKALTDALDMFDGYNSGSSDLEVKEFHCTFINPHYVPSRSRIWDKIDERGYKVSKDMNKEREAQYKLLKNLDNDLLFKMDCSKCNNKCRKSKYYDDSMADYCEPEFEV